MTRPMAWQPLFAAPTAHDEPPRLAREYRQWKTAGNEIYTPVHKLSRGGLTELFVSI